MANGVVFKDLMRGQGNRIGILSGWKFNSNNFCRFGNCLADSNSNFFVEEIVSKKGFDFLCVRNSLTYNVTVHVHVLWLVFTHLLIRCIYTVDTHKQHTAQTHHTTNTQILCLCLCLFLCVFVCICSCICTCIMCNVYCVMYNV